MQVCEGNIQKAQVQVCQGDAGVCQADERGVRVMQVCQGDEGVSG